MIEVSSSSDDIGTIGVSTTDTNTISVDADEYAEWYGTDVSTGSASGALTYEVRVVFGSTEVARITGATGGGFLLSDSKMCTPSGTYLQGAAGEDLLIEFENTSGSVTIPNAATTTYYRVRKVAKGN